MSVTETVRVAALTGDEASAEAIRQCNVDVVASYPITPQTVIMERLADYVAEGRFKGEFMLVESEHSALSACAGAAATGARTYTATSSQGLAFMHEMLYIVSGTRLPVVMSVANRSLAAPGNIAADHGDMMGSRDSGWIQAYAENVEEAYDRTIQFFRLSEDKEVRLPSAINFEGFVISHNKQRIRLFDDAMVDRFVGNPKLGDRLDPDDPMTFGAISVPENHYEFKMQQSEAIKRSLGVFRRVEKEFEALTGRSYGAVNAFNTERAENIVVIIGAAAGTMRAASRLVNKSGGNTGVLAVKLYRPFPAEEIVSHLKEAESIVVMDRTLSPGAPSAPLAEDVKSALRDRGIGVPVLSVVYGIGGRDLSPNDGAKIFSMARDRTLFGPEPIIYGVKG